MIVPPCKRCGSLDRRPAPKHLRYGPCRPCSRECRRRRLRTEAGMEKHRQAGRAYYARHPERVKSATQEWRMDNLASCRAQSKNWNRKHSELVKARRRAARGQVNPPTRPNPLACECCGKPQVQNKKTLSEDHCHQSGLFRGWLCDKCNTAIGKLGDNLYGVLQAADYLRRTT